MHTGLHQVLCIYTVTFRLVFLGDSKWVSVSCALSQALFLLFVFIQFQCVSFTVVYYIIIPTETCFLLKDRKGIDLDGRGSGGRTGRSRRKESIIRI